MVAVPIFTIPIPGLINNQEIPMLGEKLIASKVITQEQLDEVLTEQKRTDQRLGEILLDKGYATQDQIDNALK